MSKSQGPCPVCNGTGHMPCPDNLRPYASKNGWYGYHAESDTVDCTNCGAQYMFSKPSGQVNLNKDGVPCTHSYDGETVSNCYHKYVCRHCGDTYHIDSGD